MPVQTHAELVEKIKLKDDIYHFKIKAPEIVKAAKPGNFIEIRVSDTTAPFLRRPISIYHLDQEKGLVEFIFQTKGEGTKILTKKEVGDTIDVLGPLGFGTFKYGTHQKIAVIGGGIGVFPLYELCYSASKEGKNINTYLGFRNKDYVVLEKEFEDVSDKLVITTDDGSYGESGFAINFLKEDIKKEKPDGIYACGPLPMLKAVRELAIEENIPCQISLEERMGCGIGACLGCAVKTAKSPKEAPEYWHVCKGGPVFEAKEVEI